MAIRDAVTMGLHGATWEHRGYAGAGQVSELFDTLVGRPAVVCGNGAGVFNELGAAQCLYPQAVIFAANDVGMYLPHLDHWVSLHSDNLGVWKAVRWLHAKRMERTVYHADQPRPFTDYAWEGIRPMFCLSGYFAMQIAWLMGASPIVLCGCPGERQRRFFEGVPRAVEMDEFGYGQGVNGADSGVREQLEKEMERLPDFKATVRSMSGWTRTFFGGPA